MFGKSTLFALALLAALIDPLASFAQDAGVSGIPKGPGSAGGLNNSANDPSGVGNAGRIQSPAPPSTAVPVVPSAPTVSGRPSSRSAVVTKVNRRPASSRREARRASSRAATRSRDKSIDQKMSICRGC
jgi:hypothetical protein